MYGFGGIRAGRLRPLQPLAWLRAEDVHRVLLAADVKRR